jgi:rSAM/selenodomain-associated transferase 2
MRISVVIPAINEAQTIERAIQSGMAAGMDEVIVADGGSADGTPQLATQSGASVVHGERGRAIQMNLGAQHATGDVLLFLHADNWLDEAAGEQMRACLSDRAILAGAFEQHIDAKGALYRLLERGNSLRAKWRGLAYGDQAIFIRRDTFDRLGGFPQVKLMEDLLLMRALRNVGGKLQLLAGPVHVHPRRWQQRGVIRQTLCNWSLIGSEKLGVAPDRLARFYPSHDRFN